MNNSYVGYDPSFTGFGITIINEDLKTLEFYERSFEIDKKSTLKKFAAIDQAARTTKSVTSSRVSDSVYIGQEVSTAYTGWFVAELYALDYAVQKKVVEKLSPKVYNLYSQTYITYVTGHKSSLKEQTIFLLEDIIIPIFEKHGYSLIKAQTAMTKTDVKEGRSYVKRETITNNEADAFIYALKQFIDYSADDSLKQDILFHLPKLADKNKELK